MIGNLKLKSVAEKTIPIAAPPLHKILWSRNVDNHPQKSLSNLKKAGSQKKRLFKHALSTVVLKDKSTDSTLSHFSFCSHKRFLMSSL